MPGKAEPFLMRVGEDRRWTSLVRRWGMFSKSRNSLGNVSSTER